MPNPHADAIQPQSTSVEDPKHALDREDDLQANEDFNRSYQIEAIVKKLSDTSTDEYVVDLYEQGFTLPSGSDGPITRPEIIAHAMHVEDWFLVGDKVRVRLMPDHTAWIVHDPTPQLGIICCEGPNGEKDFKDNYYWVCFARFWNTGTELKPHKIKAYPKGSINSKIVCAENFFEHQCKTHLVRPGAPVVVKWNWDLHSPIPNRRYFFEIADEGTCVPPCEEKSSSSSSSSSDECKKVCWYKWRVRWRCKSKSFAPPTVSVECKDKDSPPTQPLKVWVYDGSEGEGDYTECLYSYLVKTEHCCDSPGDCGDPPPYPGNPKNAARCCPSSSSSSSSGSSDSSGSGSVPPPSDSSGSGSGSGSGPSGSGGSGGSGGGMDCNGVKDVDIETTDCKITLTLTMCDGTTRTKIVKIPCCCKPKPCNCSCCSTSMGSSSGSKPSYSGSGSGSLSMCYHSYYCYMNCKTNEYNLVPEHSETSCGPIAGQPVNQWFREPHNNPNYPDLCMLKYVMETTTECKDPADCPEPEEGPEPPTLAEARVLCCNLTPVNSSSGSGSESEDENNERYYRLYTCVGGAPGPQTAQDWVNTRDVGGLPFFGQEGIGGTCYTVPPGSPSVAHEDLPFPRTIRSLDSRADCTCTPQFWAVYECGSYTRSVFMVTNQTKVDMEIGGTLIFRLEGDIRCFRIDTTQSYPDTAGYTLTTPFLAFASCDDCEIV